MSFGLRAEAERAEGKIVHSGTGKIGMLLLNPSYVPYLISRQHCKVNINFAFMESLMSFPQVAEVVHDQTPVRNQVCFILNPVLSSVLSRTDNVV